MIMLQVRVGLKSEGKGITLPTLGGAGDWGPYEWGEVIGHLSYWPINGAGHL